MTNRAIGIAASISFIFSSFTAGVSQSMVSAHLAVAAAILLSGAMICKAIEDRQ